MPPIPGLPPLARLKESVRPYYLRWVYFPLRPAQRPPAFQACWQYPFQRFGDTVRLPPSSRGLPDLVFYPMTDWHARTQRTQHLVRAFAALGFRCIYLNPHLGREFDTPRCFDSAHRLARLEPQIYELHIRLPREPVFHERLLLPDEEEVVAAALQDILAPGAPAVQILSFPLWFGVASRFRRRSAFPLIYDCHDLLSGFDNISPAIIAAEQPLLREADLVLFSSQGLADRYPEVRRGLLVRNAASSFSQRDADSPPGPPVAGYLGALDSWFDIEALEQAAALHPQCRFLLAGRVDYEPILRLKALPNVEFAGEISYSEIPAFLRALRVALIPFRLNPLTLMTNPIKMYEYFSCGLPVVSTPLPEVRAMGDLVYIGDGAGAFARQLGEALEENDASRRSRRRAIAAQESWSARARDISEAFSLTGA